MFVHFFPISTIRRWTWAPWLVVVCSLIILPSWAEETTSDSNVQKWIGNLDDDQYATRVNAQNQLELLGLAALHAVAKTSQNGSLESSTRAINILLSWSESSDRSIRVAALEKLIALPNRPKESKIAAELLASAREEEALAAIVALGGYHTLYLKPNLGNRQQLQAQIVIGAKWKGGAEGLKHLAAVRRATTIGFHYAPIDDTAIEPLLELNRTLRFEFYGTREVSAAAIAKLEQRFPNRVVVRGGARLGISGELGSGKVTAVLKNSAAEKAGLQRDDVITELDGKKIEDFTGLIARIAEHEPGDSAVLTILRNKNPLQITVKFDHWGLDQSQLEGQDENGPSAIPPPIRLDRR